MTQRKIASKTKDRKGQARGKNGRFLSRPRPVSGTGHPDSVPMVPSGTSIPELRELLLDCITDETPCQLDLTKRDLLTLLDLIETDGCPITFKTKPGNPAGEYASTTDSSLPRMVALLEAKVAEMERNTQTERSTCFGLNLAITNALTRLGGIQALLQITEGDVHLRAREANSLLAAVRDALANDQIDSLAIKELDEAHE